MAFGFFKKKNYADCVYFNGNFETGDIEIPKASAIAIKDGIIIRVGDAEDMDDLTGPDTKVTDLEGRYAKPGLIDLYTSPAGTVLSSAFIRLNETMTQDDLINAVEEYIKEKPEEDYVFGWGYDAVIISKNEEDTSIFRKRLDELSAEKPIVLVSSDDLNMRINTAAAQIAKERADSMGLENLTPSFIMDSIISTDYEACAGPLMADALEAAKRGITSRFSCEKSTYLDNIYRDMLINISSNGLAKQRYFGSYPIKRTLPPQSYTYSMDRQATLCQELNPIVNYDTACIYCTSDQANPYYMSGEYIRELTEDIADKGYNIRFMPLDKDAALLSFSIAAELSDGYKKCTFSIDNHYDFTQEELSEVYSGSVIELPLKDDKTPAEAIGMSGKLGILSEGAYADIAVFDNEDSAEAYMTILAGEVVYTKDCTLYDWVDACNSILVSYTDDISAFEKELLQEESEEFSE